MTDWLHASGLGTETTPAWNDLFAGDEPRFERKGVLITGQNLAMGAVLGMITASGKLTLSLSAAGDGSQTPIGILAHPCDATSADKDCIYYEMGTFDELKLQIGTGHTLASIRAGLRDKGIFLKKNVPAV